LQEVQTRYTRDQIEAIIDAGRGYMPSFAHIPDESKRALLDFLTDSDRALPLEGGALCADGDAGEGAGRGPLPPHTHTGYHRFFDPDGYPAITPPCGTLNASDLNTGEFIWRVPLGEY